MTSYLGPDNPPPLSLISESFQRRLEVSKISDDDNLFYNLGEEYYCKMAKLLRLQVGINIDDKICVVASRKTKLPEELTKRLALVYPILHLTAGTSLYEETPGKERDLKVSVISLNAENYFSDKSNQKIFDKIIIADGLELIENRFEFLENIKSFLKESSDSALIILHKTKELLTLPVFLEVLECFEKQQIDTQTLLDELFQLEFLVGWNIVALPIQIPKMKWFNQLYNFYPPIMEIVCTTNIYSGLRELAETSFKYSDFLVTLKDRFLLVVATINDLHFGEQPYKMHLLDDDLVTGGLITSIPVYDKLLRLKITPEIRNMLPKNLQHVENFLDIVNKYPEEWWGTIPSASMGQLDKSRVNSNVK